jgi:hypothetical protein
MTNEEISELRDSGDLRGDGPAVRQRFEEDGYVFFRDVVNRDIVKRGYELFKRPLVAEGLLQADACETKWTGSAPKTRRPCDIIGRAIWPEIAADPLLNEHMQEILGEAPIWLPIVAHRSSLPSSSAVRAGDAFAGRHQDGFFNEGIEFVICWVPMMDISRSNGGLAVARGTHRRGWLHDPAAPPRYDVPRGQIADEDWHTAAFRAGDALFFDYRTAHTALPNHTDQIRLSLDLRAIPASAPLPVVGTVVRQAGSDIRIRTDEGKEVDVAVGDETYIRFMDPFPRIPLGEVGKVAHPGANVIAMVDRRGRATVLRPNVY